jgi:hypothetical protein
LRPLSAGTGDHLNAFWRRPPEPTGWPENMSCLGKELLVHG